MVNKMNKILIIEDDETILNGLKTAFEFHDYTVLTADSSEMGIEIVLNKNPDLIVLDIMLPGMDGFELCRKLRGKDIDTPIIILTAKSQESDRLLGFELGADDYVTKPFSAKELIARVRAILKRASGVKPEQDVIGFQDVIINFNQFTITKGEKEYPLSPKELAILKILVHNPDMVISRNRIIDEVWGDEYFPSPKTIDNFIVKLRGKIEDDAKNPRYILTVHGAGYKFKN